MDLNRTQNILLLLGRICFSLIFVVAGIDKIVHFGEASKMLTAAGLPYADVQTIIAIVLELGGGLMLFLGFYARIGAIMIFIFIIPTTIMFHNYWDAKEAVMQNQMHHFMKNLSMLGASLAFIAVGAGTLSFDGTRKKKSA